MCIRDSSNQINFDGTFTAITQHDGKCLAVDGFPSNDGNFLAVVGNSNFDGKSPLYRDRPPVRYFDVGKLPNTSLKIIQVNQRSCYINTVVSA